MRKGRRFLLGIGGCATKAALLGLSALLGFVKPGAGAENKRPSERPQAAPTQTASPRVSAPQVSPAARARLAESYGKLPLRFESNQGQTDSQVKFLSRSRGYSLFLTGGEAVLTLRNSESGVEGQRSKVESQKSKVKGQNLEDAKLETRNSKLVTRHSSLATDPAAILRFRLEGANPAATVTGLDELPGKSNYFIGNDPKKWRTNVPNYGKVKYESVYPGIDLVYYGNQSQLEYDWVIAPGADPRAIRFEIEAPVAAVSDRRSPVGTPALQIAANGDLVIPLGGTGGGEVRFRKPVVYQPVAASYARRKKDGDGTSPLQRNLSVSSPFTIHHSEFLDGRYVLTADNQVRFEISEYDTRRPLIIDPVLSFSTFLGGSGADGALGIALDSSGNLYVTGGTTSTDFPAPGAPFQPSFGGTPLSCSSDPAFFCGDAFVTKINPAGTALVYSTYLGGSDRENAFGIAVDSSGSAYVAGETRSSNFPTTLGAIQRTLNGSRDAFVTKLAPDGSALVYSTFLGGSSGDSAAGIVVDSSGNAFVSGDTRSTDFPTTLGAFQTTSGGGRDAYVAKLNPTGTALVYSTLLGGSADDTGFFLALDASGNAYVTGSTVSPNFPTANAFQASFGGGGTACSANLSSFCGDAFVAKINATGTGLLYSTYLGGSSEDVGFGIAVDSSGNAYVTGGTDSANFPTTSGVVQPTFGGGSVGCTTTGIACGDAFVAKIDTTASGAASLVYSTYLGGIGDDIGISPAVDAAGNVHLAGETNSTNFPITPATAIQTSFGGGTNPCSPTIVLCGDAFITKLNATGSALIFSTYLGGSGDEVAGLTLDSSGNVYVAGSTSSSTFPTTAGAFDTTCGTDGLCNFGLSDAFVAKMSGLALPVVTLSPTSLTFGSLGIGFTSAGQTVTLSNIGDAGLFPSISTSGDFAKTDDCFGFVSPQSSCTITVTFTPTAVGTRTGSLTITDNAAGSPHVVSLTGTGVAAPAATLSTTSLAFASQVINTTSAAQPVTLTNTGTAAMTVSSISTTGNFGQTNNCPNPSLEQSLAVGANCTINVTFTPTTLGSIVGSLTITDNAPGSPQSVTLSGRGLSEGIIGSSATSLDFGTQPVGTTSGPMTLTLNNTGTGALGIQSIVITDPFAQSNNIPAQFAQTNNCGTSIAAGASCTVNLTFSPVVLGALTGTLTITHDAAGSPTVINLTGTGGAVPFARGELFLGVGNGKVQRRSATGTLIQILKVSSGFFTTGMAFDSSGNLYVTTVTSVISKFDGNGSLRGTFGSGLSSAESILFDSAGDAFVGDVGGGIHKFDSSGNPITTILPGVRADWIDLASDQKTMLFTQEGQQIHTVDVATGVAGPDFATNLGGNAFALRILLDGSVLLANGINVLHLSSSGTVIRTFTVAGESSWFALNLDPDGTSFWSANFNTSNVYKFDIQSGNQLLNFNTGTSSFTVFGLTLRGEITAAQSLTLTLSTTALTLPDTLVNQTSTPGTVTVTNTGTRPVTISSIAVTAGNFSQTNNCPLATSEQSLAAGASCTVSVVFAPTVTGVQRGTLTITSNAPGSPQTVSLSGTGTAGLDVTLSAASLTFANQVVGTTSPAETVKLTNSGADLVTISSVVASGDFAQTNTCGTSVAVGANCTVSVTFTPTATGTRTGTLAFTDNAPDSPQVVLLTGTGTPAATVMLVPTSLTFADQPVGTTSAAMTVMVTASSSAPLAISSIAASGDFAQTNTCGTSLAAGASCAISVTFTPTTTGPRTGAITLTDNAPDSPQVVSLTGNGTAAAPAITLSATSVTLPDTHINQTCHPQTVKVTNTGTEPLAISSIAVTAGEFSATTTCPIAPATLAPGASCTISVVFHPTKLGVQNGTLTITSNAPGSPHTVALVGNGLPPCLLQAVLPSVEVVRGSDQATFTVFHDTKGEAADPIRLACVDTQPGECSLTPEVIEVPQRSTMRVTNLRSVSGSSKAFTVRGDSAGDHHLLFVQVLFSDFSFTAFPEEATVIAGRTASYALSLVPVNGLAGRVTLSCAGAPPGASCTVEPSSVNLSGTPVQVQVQVTTTSRGLAPRLLTPEFPLPTPDSRLPILWSLLALLLAAVAAVYDRRRARVRSTAILAMTAMLVVAMWAGCGGGGMTPPAAQSGGTPPGSFTVVVTGTFTPSASATPPGPTAPPLTHDIKLTLKVN